MSIRVGLLVASLALVGTIGCSSESKKTDSSDKGCACASKMEHGCGCAHCTGGEKTTAACACDSKK